MLDGPRSWLSTSPVPQVTASLTGQLSYPLTMFSFGEFPLGRKPALSTFEELLWYCLTLRWYCLTLLWYCLTYIISELLW